MELAFRCAFVSRSCTLLPLSLRCGCLGRAARSCSDTNANNEGRVCIMHIGHGTNVIEHCSKRIEWQMANERRTGSWMAVNGLHQLLCSLYTTLQSNLRTCKHCLMLLFLHDFVTCLAIRIMGEKERRVRSEGLRQNLTVHLTLKLLSES
jgi:hypothetical protein